MVRGPAPPSDQTPRIVTLVTVIRTILAPYDIGVEHVAHQQQTNNTLISVVHNESHQATRSEIYWVCDDSSEALASDPRCVALPCFLRSILAVRDPSGWHNEYGAAILKGSRTNVSTGFSAVRILLVHTCCSSSVYGHCWLTKFSYYVWCDKYTTIAGYLYLYSRVKPWRNRPKTPS